MIIQENTLINVVKFALIRAVKSMSCLGHNIHSVLRKILIHLPRQCKGDITQLQSCSCRLSSIFVNATLAVTNLNSFAMPSWSKLVEEDSVHFIFPQES